MEWLSGDAPNQHYAFTLADQIVPTSERDISVITAISSTKSNRDEKFATSRAPRKGKPYVKVQLLVSLTVVVLVLFLVSRGRRTQVVDLAPLNESPTWVYWNDGDKMYRSANGTGEAELLFTVNGLGAFDIDSLNGNIVVAATNGYSNIIVCRANEDGTDFTLINNPSLGAITQAVAINPLSKDIYVSPHAIRLFTPAYRPPGGMQILSADGSSVNTFSQRPFYVVDMEVDPQNSTVYYSTYPSWGHAPKGFTGIRKMNLDGSGDEAIFSTGQSSCFALDVDSHQIYYGRHLHYDKSTGRTIYRSSLDGSNTHALYEETQGQIRDIDLNLSRSKLYWTVVEDDGKQWLKSANTDGTEVLTLQEVGRRTLLLGLYTPFPTEKKSN